MNSLRLCGGSAATTATLAMKRTFMWRSLRAAADGFTARRPGGGPCSHPYSPDSRGGVSPQPTAAGSSTAEGRGGVAVTWQARSRRPRSCPPLLSLRVVTVIALAILWYVIGASLSSSTSAVSAVLNSLTLMLYLLVPWTALNLVDFFFVRRGHYAITDIFRPDGVYGA